MIILVDDLAINTDSHFVTYHGEYIDLTAREFEILAILAEKPNHAISASDLFLHIKSGKVNRNLVEQHIYRIRNKLEKVGPRNIFTIRRVGYMLRTKEYI